MGCYYRNLYELARTQPGASCPNTFNFCLEIKDINNPIQRIPKDLNFSLPSVGERDLLCDL